MASIKRLVHNANTYEFDAEIPYNIQDGEYTMRGTYKGELKNGVPDGYGTWKRAGVGNEIYEGHWKNGKMDGMGRYTEDQDFFIGEFKEGKKMKGKQIYNSDDEINTVVFEGNFKYNRAASPGVAKLSDDTTIVFTSDEVLQTEMKGEEPDIGTIDAAANDWEFAVYGQVYFPNGSKFFGSVSLDGPDGKGKLVNQFNDQYEEIWCGYNIYNSTKLWLWTREMISVNYNEGSTFEGRVTYNCVVGFMRYKNGDVYRGPLTMIKPFTNKLPKPNTNETYKTGKMVSKNGRTYEGGFKHGLQHGRGTETFSKFVLEGIWKDGELQSGRTIDNEDGSITYYGDYETNDDIIDHDDEIPSMGNLLD